MAASDVEVQLERCYTALEWAADEMHAAELEMQKMAIQRDSAIHALSLRDIKPDVSRFSSSNSFMEGSKFCNEMESMLIPMEKLAQGLDDLLELVQGSVQYVMEVSTSLPSLVILPKFSSA
jgi:hypothetical protein